MEIDLSLNEILVSRRNLILEYLRITINSYHQILSRFSDNNINNITNEENKNNNTIINEKEKENENENENEYERDDNVMICLDLFTILCNYGIDLIDYISVILDSTPFDAWVQLIPQLFSRLGHSQPVIRQQIEKLVMGITRSYPSKIIFPVLSGIDSGTVNITNKSLQLALQRTLAKLRESDKLSLILLQVSDMKIELSRISVLWEDKWLQIIQEIKHMMPSRIRLLQHEINLIPSNRSKHSSSHSSSHSTSPNTHKHNHNNQNHKIDNSELLLESYQLIMAPILELLTSLETTITSIPTTPHEYKFQRKYGRRINILLKKFRSPSPISVKSPSVLWSSELAVLLDAYFYPCQIMGICTFIILSSTSPLVYSLLCALVHIGWFIIIQL